MSGGIRPPWAVFGLNRSCPYSVFIYGFLEIAGINGLIIKYEGHRPIGIIIATF
jgi:hypothetical protein